ncbi:hypothetical protein GUI12_01000 [Anaplasmataceae bacterium AB001_6]|nr:hypothetical protein GUI12_01000 [Anaplasmataceae bacterium AB001_6]
MAFYLLYFINMGEVLLELFKKIIKYVQIFQKYLSSKLTIELKIEDKDPFKENGYKDFVLEMRNNTDLDCSFNDVNFDPLTRILLIQSRTDAGDGKKESTYYSSDIYSPTLKAGDCWRIYCSYYEVNEFHKRYSSMDTKGRKSWKPIFKRNCKSKRKRITKIKISAEMKNFLKKPFKPIPTIKEIVNKEVSIK